MKLSKAHNTPIIRPSKGCLLLIWMSEENDWLLLFVCVGVWEIVYISFCLSVPFTFGKCPTLPDEAALVLQQQQQWRCSGACETRRVSLFCTTQKCNIPTMVQLPPAKAEWEKASLKESVMWFHITWCRGQSLRLSGPCSLEPASSLGLALQML